MKRGHEARSRNVSGTPYTLRFPSYKNIAARVMFAFKRPGLKIAVGAGIRIGITSNENSLFRFVRQIDTGLQGMKMALF